MVGVAGDAGHHGASWGVKLFGTSKRIWMPGLKVAGENHIEHMQPRRELALPILGGGPKVDRKHRLSGHKTQRTRRSAEGSGDAKDGPRGQGSSPAPGGPRIH